MSDDEGAVSYSHRVCRRCGADLVRVRAGWLGTVWRCSRAETHTSRRQVAVVPATRSNTSTSSTNPPTDALNASCGRS